MSVRVVIPRGWYRESWYAKIANKTLYWTSKSSNADVKG